MKVTESMLKFIINAYRVCISYDFQLIAHMVWNRLRHRHYVDFLRADWTCKFQFLRRHYGHILEKCRQAPIKDIPNDGPIWVLWWQGEEQMPNLVRLCYESLKKNAPSDKPVILLHAENYAEYVNIPKYIIEKFERKVITITHLSDIIRFSLLAEHGGLWIDSTIFFSEKMPKCVFEKTYFSGKMPFYPNSVSRSRYTPFMLGASAGSPLAVYARDMLYEYWKKSWKLLDYILISYVLTLALDEIPDLQEYFIKCTIPTPHINAIQELRNEPCNVHIYHKMISECPFFKLSHKLDFRERDEEGRLTYYGMLCSSAGIHPTK